MLKNIDAFKNKQKNIITINSLFNKILKNDDELKIKLQKTKHSKKININSQSNT